MWKLFCGEFGYVRGLEADVPGAASTSHGPVVCLLGDGPQDAAGDRLLAKKLKKEDWKDGGHWAC